MNLAEQLAQFVRALPEENFFGRSTVLAALVRAADDAREGRGSRLGLTGPSGAGKSEALRQAAVQLANQTRVLPIYLDLNTIAGSGAGERPHAESETWSRLVRAAIAQALVLRGIRAEDAVASNPLRLADCCRDAELGAVALLAAQTGPDNANLGAAEACWRALPAALRDAGAEFAVVLIDGVSGPDEFDNARWLRRIVEATPDRQWSLAFEMPGPGASPPAEVTRYALRPLAAAEAQACAVSLGERLGWELPSTARGPALERLGPWPGWLRDWAEQVRATPAELSPVRRAEQGYLDFLMHGAWAQAFSAAFERRVPLAWRDRALRLAQTVTAESRPMPAERALQLMGQTMVASESPREPEIVLAGLESLGLLRRAGDAFEGPAEPALIHWTQLRMDAARGENAAARRRVTMLRDLLTLPRETYAAQAGPGVAALLAQVVGGFRCQTVPEMLFQFGRYYEALGRLEPAQRREAVRHATATQRLPEVVAFARWDQAGAQAGASAAAPLYHALAYRGGKYQRSHEQHWLVLDLTAAATLTSPEIESALARAEEARRAFGPAEVIVWLLLGEEISPEALKVIDAAAALSSNREQLAYLDDCIKPAPPRRPPGAVRAALADVKERLKQMQAAEAQEAEGDIFGAGREEDEAAHEIHAKDAPKRGAVIDAAAAAKLPGREVNRLSLPARADSELIAALMAEKIAIHAGFDSAGAGRVKTAVLEGVLNAIEHSPNEEKSIQLEIALHEDRLEVLIENEGAAFDPQAVEAPVAEQKLHSRNKRGWGMKLMQRFMDEVGYEPCAHGTRLRMTKRRPLATSIQARAAGRG